MNVADWRSREEWPEPRPRVASWSPFEDRLGDKAVALCELAGLYLDEWQEISLRIWLGLRLEDPAKFAHRRNGMIVPRQDGKGAILEARQLAGLYLPELESERLIIHTAHEFKTATESFIRLAGLVEDTPKLNRLVKDIYYANGKEAIVLRNGKRVKFLARSGKSGRGFTSDLLIFDEAMDLPQATVGASGPTQSVRPNPQTIYTATAGNDQAEVLAKVRDEGIEGVPRLSYVEYSAGDPDDHVGDGIDLDDRDEWYRANPAMHGPNPRMTEEAVETDRAQMDDENFARERLCLWWVQRRVSVLDPDRWQDLIKKSQAADRTCFAVDVPPERSSASIAVASPRTDGLIHVEVIDHKEGTAWVVPRLVELDGKWKPDQIAILQSSPAGSLIEEIAEALKKERVPVYQVSGSDYAAACGQFLDRFTEDIDGKHQLVIHNGPHVNVLTAAADAARKREFIEGGFVWNRRDAAANIAPLVAVTLASYALGVEPKKKRKTGKYRGV